MGLAGLVAKDNGNLNKIQGESVQAEKTLSLTEAFTLTSEQTAHLSKWVDLVAKRYRDLKWEKLISLAPHLEIQVAGKGSPRLRLHFQKLEDSFGNLTGIFAMALDASPTQNLKRKLEEERVRHRLEIRDILALSANPPETLGPFLTDASIRLERVKGEWDQFLTSRKGQRDSRSGPWQNHQGESLGPKLFRELHLVKGNAGAFGFEGLAAIAQEAEDFLESLKQFTVDSDQTLSRLTHALTELRTQVEEIRRTLKLISGEGQEAMVRILKWKMDRLIAAANSLDADDLDPNLRSWIEATGSLAFLSPAYLARKYRNLVERLALNQGKKIAFKVTSNTGDIHPECFSRVDEALVHILRNMVDHGIETPSERAALGKPEAEIGLEYVTAEDRIFIRIRDNGRGMNPDLIADRAVRLGLVTTEEIATLEDTTKLELIFREGFTTRDEANLISGRGVGLALAARCVQDQGGQIYVYAKPDEGTRFALELPHLGQSRISGSRFN